MKDLFKILYDILQQHALEAWQNYSEKKSTPRSDLQQNDIVSYSLVPLALSVMSPHYDGPLHTGQNLEATS
jgi:hypothetical protein